MGLRAHVAKLAKRKIEKNKIAKWYLRKHCETNKGDARQLCEKWSLRKIARNRFLFYIAGGDPGLEHIYEGDV